MRYMQPYTETLRLVGRRERVKSALLAPWPYSSRIERVRQKQSLQIFECGSMWESFGAFTVVFWRIRSVS